MLIDFDLVGVLMCCGEFVLFDFFVVLFDGVFVVGFVLLWCMELFGLGIVVIVLGILVGLFNVDVLVMLRWLDLVVSIDFNYFY